ncbi:MAG: hypothetical protein ACI9TH_000491 [Kiritimatiellia bacterium]|jgi:hypothetical protein
MRIEIGRETPEAIERLPEHQSDGSRIGVNYADVIMKGIAADLPDGGKVSCKRRGLLLSLMVGEKKGEGLMRRLEFGPEPKVIFHAALQEAAEAAGVGFTVEDGGLFLEI